MAANWRSFVTEKKKLFKVEFTRDVVQIGEKSKSMQVSVGFEVDLIQWIKRKLKQLIKGEGKVGFYWK